MSRTDGAAASIEAGVQPQHAYDYGRQTWLTRHTPMANGTWTWQVSRCGHPLSMGLECCYAGLHHGEVVVHHGDIR